MSDVVNAVNKKYVKISNRLTPAYEKEFGLKCDLYFPRYDTYKKTVKYRDMNIFAPHESYTYSCYPDVEQTTFYIVNLFKAQSMNSAETEFDSFYDENNATDRPFIETTKQRELPIGTKVVVYSGMSIFKFFVDKKLVVNGANGHMLLRMSLAPLAKDCDGEIEEQEETVEDMTKEEKIYYENLEKEPEMDVPEDEEEGGKDYVEEGSEGEEEGVQAPSSNEEINEAEETPNAPEEELEMEIPD